MKKNMGSRLGLYPTPVVLVGVYDSSGKPNVLTLAWVGVACSEPPCIQISVRKERWSHDAIEAKAAFSVNVPSSKYVAEVDYAGIASGRDADKFQVSGLTAVKGEVLDVPLVKEFPVSMECKLVHTARLGSHDLYVGEIVACWMEESVAGQGAKVNAKEFSPLIYMPGGEYYGLGEFLGNGFNAGKKFLKK
ncbi:MAG: flavin reductase family protein [Synergistaceae bacterium]|jgi:flavin reductase (DIM6/NTAB) family NADH-FMN oxidoreductase RutF|nr:flavin reductase family protein [Synergistaceae bacterium]